MSSERGVRGELCGGIRVGDFNVKLVGAQGRRYHDQAASRQAGRQASIGFFLFLVSLCV